MSPKHEIYFPLFRKCPLSRIAPVQANAQLPCIVCGQSFWKAVAFQQDADVLGEIIPGAPAEEQGFARELPV